MLTCEFCNHDEAVYLLIVDYTSGNRHKSIICKGCMRNAMFSLGAAQAERGSFYRGWWLYDMRGASLTATSRRQKETA